MSKRTYNHTREDSPLRPCPACAATEAERELAGALADARHELARWQAASVDPTAAKIRQLDGQLDELEQAAADFVNATPACDTTDAERSDLTGLLDRLWYRKERPRKPEGNGNG